MSDIKTLYDYDFFAWTKQQAEALRTAARAGSNLPLDWKNLAEEIESLGTSQRSALRSQIRRIIRHLAKLEFSPARDPRRGWFESIVDARSEIGLLLRDSPSLRRQLGRMVAEETGDALKLAVFDLDKFGEIDPATRGAMQITRYTREQVLGDWFPPDSERSAPESPRSEQP